ncbi:pre-mRNA-splicing factor CWC22 homolog [Leptinotarsa decemlineata]|uniref:pre-mRNA-splicing factor CWC22 homolog n=1 Tax=Leptinotarsa decemlineata TaxID=7539 RepID=UPI003D30B6EF
MMQNIESKSSGLKKRESRSKSMEKEETKHGKKRPRKSRSRSLENGQGKKKSQDYDDLPKDYPRYYGEDRPNSDRYWNKYPRKDNIKVGQRYYEAGCEKKEKKREEKPAIDKEPEDKSVIKPRERKTVDLLTSRTGGAYIPPAKLRMMQESITDKSSAAYQRIAWEALKKSIHGYINKINTSNIGIIARELLHENIVRGRGLLCKSIIQAQAASPTFTNVYAALVAVINSKFPNIGELLLKRLVLQFKRGFKQNNKVICISATTFVAHLVNQKVAHEILALEILTLLVESPTDDSVEVAISFLKECGQKLTEVSSKGITAIFEMLRNILHEGKLEKRIQYMIEVMFQIRKDGFKDHAAVLEELDIVEEEDQFTHLITLEDVKQVDTEDILNVFKFDDKYEENEGKYKTLSKEILGSDSESGSGSEGSEDGSEDDEEDEEVKDQGKIIDNTETNLIVLRRTIYLTIQSSLDFEECAHKLLKMELKPGQEIELCHMFLDCCAEQRTYEKFYGLLAQRFCQINKIYIEPFQKIFKDTYATTHRLDANRLRNVSKFFAHLLFTDAISWEVLEIMKLNEEDTNSSSRIFIKILFQELAEYMGLGKLNTRLKDETLQEHFAGLFPRDSPKNTRFSINFFTSIGLGGLTDELREHLKKFPKNTELNLAVGKESSSSSSSSSSSETSSEESSDESSSSEDEKQNRRGKVYKKKNEIERKGDHHSTKKKERYTSKDDHKQENERHNDSSDRRKKKDYERVKSRSEDNGHRLKNERRVFEKHTSEKRSQSKDHGKYEKSRRHKNKDDRERRNS